MTTNRRTVSQMTIYGTRRIGTWCAFRPEFDSDAAGALDAPENILTGSMVQWGGALAGFGSCIRDWMAL